MRRKIPRGPGEAFFSFTPTQMQNKDHSWNLHALSWKQDKPLGNFLRQPNSEQTGAALSQGRCQTDPWLPWGAGEERTYKQHKNTSTASISAANCEPPLKIEPKSYSEILMKRNPSLAHRAVISYSWRTFASIFEDIPTGFLQKCAS